MINQFKTVKAFAPATSANVAVGFDILGFAVGDLGDEITLTKNSDELIRIKSISGSENIPLASDKNTATVAMHAMLKHLKVQQGFDVTIKKNIPLSSGLGGSAASSVAALVALNRFLNNPVSREELVEFALAGEEIACGSKHADNVIPSLFGGMTLIQSVSPLHVIELPLIPLHVVLVHPHLHLDTRVSRAVLKSQICMSSFVKHSARLASFISALYETDYDRLEAACVDDVIEPMRAHLIPDFYEVKSEAYQHGALACSISGSGPTMFAFAKTKVSAQKIGAQMRLQFKKSGIESDVLITTMSSEGAKIIDEK